VLTPSTPEIDPMHPHVHHHPRARLSGRRRLLCGALLTASAAAVAPAAASAALIPPPGPWPTDIVGAANPLTGTPFGSNGAHATGNADLEFWLPVGRHRPDSLTTTPTKNVVVQGQLRNRDNHHSIAGATVTLATQNVYAPEWTTLINLVTDRKGRFAAQVGPGYHRRFGVIYYPAVTSSAPIYSRRVLVRARSSVTLTRPYHQGRAYRFDGQVRGGIAPVPATGLLIALQVRNRSGNWITARLAKTTASGRFRVRYRFPRSASLTVRIAAPSQTGWALYAGHSNRWTIRPR